MRNILFAGKDDAEFYSKAAAARTLNDSQNNENGSVRTVKLNINQIIYALGASLLMRFSALFIKEEPLAKKFVVAAKEAWKEFVERNRFDKNISPVSDSGVKIMVASVGLSSTQSSGNGASLSSGPDHPQANPGAPISKGVTVAAGGSEHPQASSAAHTPKPAGSASGTVHPQEHSAVPAPKEVVAGAASGTVHPQASSAVHTPKAVTGAATGIAHSQASSAAHAPKETAGSVSGNAHSQTSHVVPASKKVAVGGASRQIGSRKTVTDAGSVQVSRLKELSSLSAQHYMDEWFHDPAVRSSLAEYVPGDEIGNTFCTKLLHSFAFSPTVPDDTKALNRFLVLLQKEALAGKGFAITALKTPNKTESHQTHSKNTPLQLLVKMDNLEGIKAVLPVLDAFDLSSLTSEGNSALHIAVLTARFDIALALLRRAKELNVLDQMLAQKNSAGKTADDIRQELVKMGEKSELSKASLDFFERLGGKEVAKSRLHVSDSTMYVYFDSAITWLKKHAQEDKDKTLSQLLECTTRTV